jgi:hypothetical protein
VIHAPALTGVIMSNLFWLTYEQMDRLRPFFPKSHGKPGDYGPPKTLYNRGKRWGDMGVFALMMEGSASEGGDRKTIMIDATDLNAHRTASSLRARKGEPTTCAGV